MAVTIIVLHNQTFHDIAIQYAGDVSKAFLIASANGRAISDDLVAGETLVIPNTERNDVLTYFTQRVIQPATAINNLISDVEEPQLEGIGYWFIGDDNIVS